jgi:hypothetical protein
MDHEIDRHIFRRILDRRNYCLGIFQIDVPGNGKTEKAALLLTWIIVITRVPCNFSIARIACARRSTYHRAVSKGCSTMITIKIQKSDEKSNDMTSAYARCR